MKVKVPPRIKLAGHWYSIVYEKGLGRRHGKYGQVDGDALRISIEPAVPDSLKTHTLLHEIIHALSDQFVYGNALDESTVSQLATGTWVTLESLGAEFDWSLIKED